MIDANVNGAGPARNDAGGLASVSTGGREAGGANGTSGSANGATPDAGDGFALANLAFAEELYFQFLRDPGSVEPAWRAYFEGLDGAGARAPAAAIPPQAFARSIFAPAPAPKIAEGNLTASRTSVRLLSERVQRLVEAYREFGHLAANLDPLGLLKRTGASLKLEDHGLAEEDLDLVFSSENVAGPDRTTLRDLVELLRDTYTRQIGVELAHLHDIELRGWLQSRMERTRNRLALTRADRMRLLEQVIGAEVFEQFLQNKFLGAKRFSMEGGESLIPLLERLIERAARSNVVEIVIGMAHRGRLNVLANVLKKPPSQIFGEFLDKQDPTMADESSGGDVKYHLGFSIDRTFPGTNGPDAHKVHLSLTFNPSHLEWVNTVVQGRVRAKQDRISDGGRTRCLPLLLHGDAAFAGQGIVAEAFNMSELDGYRVGGTVHIVINNQVGFTTSPQNAKSTTYATDVARMLQIPIFHVNGEDPEAVCQVVDLAVDFRQRFHRDALIELWCYRKHGHNEGDEPSYTQPIMYRAIASKPSIRSAYLDYGRKNPLPDAEAPISVVEADALAARKRHELEFELEVASRWEAPPRPTMFAGAWERLKGGAERNAPQVTTAVTREAIELVGSALTRVPQGFNIHPKLKKLIIEARAAMAAGEKPCDWGMGEALAFGTLLAQGIRVRLSGQDSRRGTFSHRHSTFFDTETEAEHTPLQHVRDKQGVFEARDSPLSEAGVLGFEYGYSLDMPEGLTIWEAQFGDFVNAAQVIIDQFLASSEAKWHRVSGLVLLLPHGMEGQGPEHSNARLDRFLTLSVKDNWQVCNFTTPAQYFHALRRQVLRPYRKPLVVMSPKSLLRHPVATSPLSDFTDGAFQYVIPDTSIDPQRTRRVLFCTGKVYYDLLAAREERGAHDVAIVRIEQLYPMHKDDVLKSLADVPGGTPVLWVQEEPKNMGAWNYVNREFTGLLKDAFPWECVSRPLAASPATGSPTRHKREQAALMDEAFGIGVGKEAS
ncbi:MAG TPA: 2-oxoglutarate dehydrogenase E1 component [Polyangia bacterium]|jgi:2-oxoglutarate dehydrogenase E1 component|nr:2-oxoglutarate dehydrogenase E1 component [Polyangia bacterium]